MAFDNDADFVSFTDLGDEPQGTWEVEAAVKDKPTRSQRRRRTPAPTPVPIKGRTAQLKEQDREEEEEGPPDSSFAMDLSFDNDLKTPKGVTVTRIPALTESKAHPQEAAISAANALENGDIPPIKPMKTNLTTSTPIASSARNSRNTPKYTGGYDSPIPKNSSLSKKALLSSSAFSSKTATRSPSPMGPLPRSKAVASLQQPPPPPSSTPPPPPPPPPAVASSSSAPHGTPKFLSENLNKAAAVTAAAARKLGSAEKRKADWLTEDDEEYTMNESGMYEDTLDYEEDNSFFHDTTGDRSRASGSSRRGGEYLPWVEQVDWFDKEKGGPAGINKLFNEEARVAARWLAPTDIEHKVRCMIVDIIVDAIRDEFRIEAPRMEVEPFGSHVNKLYLPGGDIDIVIVRDSMPPRLCASPRDIRTLFTRIIKALRKRNLVERGDFREVGVQFILSAKCPIVKFKTIPGNISVDISVYDDGGIRASRVVRNHLKEFPAAKDLVLLVKAYMRRAKVNEVFMGGLGSYSTFCLVINFMQMHPDIRSKRIDTLRNLGVLLQEFFESWSSFDWTTLGISLRDGGEHFRKRARGWNYPNNHPMNIAIEDPQDPSNNVSKGSTEVVRIFSAWNRACELIEDNLDFQEGTWNNIVPGSKNHPSAWRDKQGEFDRTKMSILSGIIGFRGEILDHRRDLEDLYRGGQLQRELRLTMPSQGRSRQPSPSTTTSMSHTMPSRKVSEAGKRSFEGPDRQTEKRRKDDNFGAIHMNDDPHEQPVSDNSDEELQYLDRLAQKATKGKPSAPSTSESGNNPATTTTTMTTPKLTRRQQKKKNARERRAGLADEIMADSAAATTATATPLTSSSSATSSRKPTPAVGSKEVEMGLVDEDDYEGGKSRPISIDEDEEDEAQVIEILDGPNESDSSAEMIRFQDTLPSSARMVSKKSSTNGEKSKKGGDGSVATAAAAATTKMSRSDRQKFWAEKGPKQQVDHSDTPVKQAPTPTSASSAKASSKSRTDNKKTTTPTTPKLTATDSATANSKTSTPRGTKLSSLPKEATKASTPQVSKASKAESKKSKTTPKGSNKVLTQPFVETVTPKKSKVTRVSGPETSTPKDPKASSRATAKGAEASSTPKAGPKKPANTPKQPGKTSKRHTRGQEKGGEKHGKGEDFSNLKPQQTDAIDQNADFVSLF